MLILAPVLLLFALTIICTCVFGFGLDSPVYPRTGSCEHPQQSFTKVTTKKFLLGVMFKDEEGYLAEFLSYYKVQGIDHVILWDNNSTDDSLLEIDPWVKSGFAEVRELEPLNQRPTVRYTSTAKFYRMMALKKETERQNILWGLLNGYDYYITGDLDEYAFAVPNVHGHAPPPGGERLTSVLADAVELMFWPPQATRGPRFKPRLYFPITKVNYNAQPHVLEPPDALTLEVFLTRYDKPGGMNYYMNVMPKYVYRLQGSDLAAGPPSSLPYYEDLSFGAYTGVNLTDFQAFLSNCCYIHGCETKNPRNAYCFKLGAMEKQFGFETNPLGVRSPFALRMNHYARSFEKHELKARTWATANHISATGYDIKEYLHRTYGWVYDPVLLPLACAVRAEWGRVVGAGGQGFFREGRGWARNPEIGRSNAFHSGPVAVPYNAALFRKIVTEGNSTAATMSAAISDEKLSSSLLFPEYYGS